ncbi:ATP-dependent chaperone ClpB [Labilibacter marinus]|uniref:ATP-dependent chaperone ClpB n=1 Tax=Labilibacter marinus TaxID=1477105 RepID=UPI00082D4FA4|nr:ATP-dependent chaperone ClpB [Labilibacter marinus]
MNLKEYTIKSQEAIQKAIEIATGLNHQAIEPGHILMGILQVDKNVIPHLLNKLSAQNIEVPLKAIVEGYPKVSGGEPYLSKSANELLMKAKDYLREFNDEFVSVEHLMLGILKVKDAVSNLLKDAGVTEQALKAAIQELRKGAKVDSPSAEDNYNALNRYAVNLNERARSGKLDPVIGRDEEIRRVLQILSRRTKNNPILIGEPGVGKTAIGEGIAIRIVNGDVPENLKSKLIYSLDMGALIAGAKYKGEFEERLKAVVKEVTSSDGDIVMFIDEIHTLVGAGKGEGAMDAANILKPALARGELRAVGATTLSEYQKYFEKDKALERRFQQVMVNEPDTISAISILRGLKERYENHHKVRIKDDAIIAAVNLSTKYISDRFLPDKAIDLIDEAAAKLRLEMNSVPEELDELDRKVKQLEIEREAIKREGDGLKLQNLVKELSELKDLQSDFRAKWQEEKSIVDDIQKQKTDIEHYKFEAEKAEREGLFDLVAELRYGKIKVAEERIEELKQELKDRQLENALIKEEVDSEDVAGVVSRWTGIPITKMLKSEKEKLLNLESELHKRVVGQEEAIEAVSDAIRRSRAGLQDEKRPVGSFIFLGMSGVGKTELAKALATYLFDDENKMTRIDMSEFQERHSVSRLIGAPPGYVGYDEGGQLTEAVRRKPYSVVLLDEIEKAHPDVFNVLLQVLDDGRLTDNKGRVVDFKNTIIIMTSNAGSHLIQKNFDAVSESNSEEVIEKTKKEVFELLRSTIRPEFLNRIDDIIMFTPLSRKEIEEIVALQFNGIKKTLASKQVQIDISTEAISFIASAGFDPLFGARPIKRVLQKQVLNELSKRILADAVDKNKKIMIDHEDNSLVFSN